MGFTKTGYVKEVTIAVTHPYYPGTEFAFPFSKLLTASAIEAEKRLLALKEDEQDDVARKALIDTVAEMLAKTPEGFADFPQDERPLPERAREYFDMPEHPEIEAILVAAWREYKRSSQVTAEVLSLEERQKREATA